jgi:glycosyltransferase involved in cell wall biosynthesis
VVRLSAVICVQNQDAKLSACLRALSFCDEIVVVADRCTDRSHEIARRHGAVVIDGIFPLLSQRKAAGVEAATGDWVLELEPDEVVDRALAWEIRAVLQMRPAGDWYELPIDNYVGETRIRHGWIGNLSANRAARLYKPGIKAWEPQRVESAAVLAGRSGGALKGALQRHLGSDLGGLVERLNRLSALQAEDLADLSVRAPFGRTFLAALAAFLQSYVARNGWREGRYGFLVGLLSGLLPLLSQMRAHHVMTARAEALALALDTAHTGEVVGLNR